MVKLTYLMKNSKFFSKSIDKYYNYYSYGNK
jgi:hypothetical protein